MTTPTELAATDRPLFAESKQIATAPKFGNWGDRRFSEALNPLLNNR